jgi:5-formyltetrahydrofolate cyclo-ligase
MKTKQELRNYWLEKRTNLTEPQKNILSHQIQDLFTTYFNIQAINCIHVFLPVLEKCEVRTWSLIQYLLEKYPHIKVCAPSISDIKNRKMDSILLEHNTSYTKNKWGIEEPASGATIKPEEIDMILLPLIVFDKNGNRLGYGGGFYDRYLTNCSKAKKIGLSYFNPIDEIPEINTYDIKMDFCVTPEMVYNF